MNTTTHLPHLDEMKTPAGATLREFSHNHPTLVVFLRHLGCPFCRETLMDLRARRSYLDKRGIRLVLVHMAADEEAGKLFSRYGLGDVIRISDPERKFYRAFGLQEGDWGQILGPRIWWRGFQAAILRGLGWGKPRGSVRQLPGVFLIHKGRVVLDFRHETSADRPDYDRMAESVGRLN